MLDCQWLENQLEKAGQHAFDVMVEQMERNPDAIEALYGES